MKKSILSIIAILSVAITFAQNEVFINFNHLLDGQNFGYNQAVTVDGDYDVEITRLEYYLSDISITHDGGIVTNLSDVYLLVQPSVASEYSLGSWDINNIESVQMGFGVQSEVNNLDPATYPSGHPLAFHNPSMHWGWASGYRFIALEGGAGDGFIYDFEIHALGNNNYGYVTLDYNNVMANDGEIHFGVDASYEKLFTNVDVANGAIVHSSTDIKAIKTLNNAKTLVFAPGEVVAGIEESTLVDAFDIYPNPVDGTEVNFVMNSTENGMYTIEIFDMLGKQISAQMSNDPMVTFSVEDLNAGIYFVKWIQDGQLSSTKRFVVR